MIKVASWAQAVPDVMMMRRDVRMRLKIDESRMGVRIDEVEEEEEEEEEEENEDRPSVVLSEVVEMDEEDGC